MSIRIDNWSLVCETAKDVYKAPEQRKVVLHGYVTNHPNHRDGTEVFTSEIMSVSKRSITTKHTTYVLGKIDPKYREFLKNHTTDWNWRRPLGTNYIS